MTNSLKLLKSQNIFSQVKNYTSDQNWSYRKYKSLFS